MSTDINVWKELSLLREVWGFDELPATERWEWLGLADALDIQRIRYRGRTGSVWKTEAGLPHTQWSMPKVALNRYPALAPWSHAVDLTNSKDGITLDEVYLGMRLKRGLKKGAMRVNMEVPDVATLPAGTLIEAGFEVNSQGGAADVYVVWRAGVMGMDIIPLTEKGIGFGVGKNIVQHNPGALGEIHIDFNPPVLRVTQGLTTVDELICPDLTNVFSMVPFVCNESTVIVKNVYLGDSWAVWETDDQSTMHSSVPFVNPATNPEIDLDVGNRRTLEVFVASIAGGKTVNLYGSYDRVNWRLCNTYTTDAATGLFHKGLFNAYRFVKLELIEIAAGTSTLELTANGGA